MATAISNFIVDAVASVWTAANFPTGAVTKGAGWDYTHLVNVRKVLQQRGVPEGQRFYVCNSDVYASLLQDPLIVAEFNNARNAGAIATGQLPTVAGLQIGEYPDLPNNGENLVAFAGSPDSVLAVNRGPRNPEELFGDRGANVRMDWLQGKDKGNNNNGIRIKSA